MNCAECQGPMGPIAVSENKWAAQLSSKLVCQQCLEDRAEVESSLLDLPAGLRHPDISAYSKEAVEKARAWGSGQISLLTITRGSGSVLNGRPLAAWAAEMLSGKRVVRWAEHQEVPKVAAVLPDVDLIDRFKLPTYGAQIRGLIDRRVPLLLLTNCDLDSLPEAGDHILLKIAVDGQIVVV